MPKTQVLPIGGGNRNPAPDVLRTDERSQNIGQYEKALSRIIPELAADADLNASSSEKENNPEKLKIKEWLRTHGKTRQWLAEQCRVSVRTVHTWFAFRGSIPVTQSLFIGKLMSEGEPWKIQISNTIPVIFQRRK